MTALELLKHLRAAGVGDAKILAVRQRVKNVATADAQEAIDALVDAQFDPSGGSETDEQLAESCRVIAARTGRKFEDVLAENSVGAKPGRGKMLRDWSSTVQRAKDIAAGLLPVVRHLAFSPGSKMAARDEMVYEYPDALVNEFAEFDAPIIPDVKPEAPKRGRPRKNKELEPAVGVPVGAGV